MSDQKLSLSWDSYQKNICNGLGLLQQRGEFVDMTIAADGHQVKVHQMIMSLVSPYIKELITSAQCPHPIIFLNRVSHQTLHSILEYAYTGEVLVTRDRLCDFLEACKALHIKGLENENITAANGDILRFISSRENQEPVQLTTQKQVSMNPPWLTDNKKNRIYVPERKPADVAESKQTDDAELDNAPALLYDDSPMEESNLDESALDNTIDHYETIELDISQQDGSVAKKDKIPGSTIQYSLSCQGSIQIVLNRFLYRMRHTRKNNERLWRCQDYYKKSCPAYAITRGDTILERGCAHNHPFHDKQILKRVRNGNMYSAFNAVENIASLSKNASTNKKTGNTEIKITEG